MSSHSVFMIEKYRKKPNKKEKSSNSKLILFHGSVQLIYSRKNRNNKYTEIKKLQEWLNKV